MTRGGNSVTLLRMPVCVASVSVSRLLNCQFLLLVSIFVVVSCCPRFHSSSISLALSCRMSHISMMVKWKEIGEGLGFEGEALAKFIKDQQDEEREVRAAARDKERELREQEERDKVRAHELRLAELNATANQSGRDPIIASATPGSESLRLPPLGDNDDVTAYIMRFEKLARVMRVPADLYAFQLSSLLRGKALSVYSSLPAEITDSYSELKKALLKAFKQTPDHYREKFRRSTISSDESHGQFIAKLGRYLDYWLDSLNVDKSFEGLKSFFIRDQFLSACPQNLRLFLTERNSLDLTALAEMADNFDAARSYTNKNNNNDRVNNSKTQGNKKENSDQNETPNSNRRRPLSSVKCYDCGTFGHYKNKCPQNPEASVRLSDSSGSNPPNNNLPGSSNVRKVYSVSACYFSSRDSGPKKKRKTVSGNVNGRHVDGIIRDTGCDCLVVSESLLPQEPADCETIDLYDYLGRKDTFPLVPCYIDCQYIRGWYKVAKAPINVDMLVGDDSDDFIFDVNQFTNSNNVCSVKTRAQSNKANIVHPLYISEIEPFKVSPEEFKELQNSCESLSDLRTKIDSKIINSTKAGTKFKYERRNGFIYRVCVDSERSLEIGKAVLVVPLQCRSTVLQLAHDAPTSGHFSHRKTTAKVLDDFYWPGVTSDIVSYCRSCDICQRTSAKGRVKKVPLQKMPVISTPFKRIAIDLIGPLIPPSTEGHRFVLTIVDLATRFPEAIPMKNIDTLSVAEGLVTVFSRVGIPDEILSDRGGQFTSELMGEIDRLLGVQPLFTTPYHPQGNSVCERMNGVIKSVLKKLCQEKPSDWHRYLPAVLFAIREMPNDTLKFSPFELLYGRRVKGPLTLLHELWAGESAEDEVRTTYQYVLELRDRLSEAAQMAAENTSVSTDMYKLYFDRNTKDRQFSVGDEVLLLLPTNHNKLLMQWNGPYKIVEKKNSVDYVIDVKGKYKLFHANMLKKYYRRQSSANADNEHNVCVSVLEPMMDTHDSIHVLENDSESQVNINESLSNEQKFDAQQLLSEFSDTLTDVPGCTESYTHKIALNTTKPIRKKQYPVPVHLQDEFNKNVDELLKLGVIEPSNSPYCSPVVLIKKPDGKSYRLCIDFRDLNDVTTFDAEPMPTVDQDLHKFSGAKYFSELDLCKAYFQIPLDVESRKFTAFQTNKGLMQFVRMPFGLSTACASYVRLMRKVFNDIPGISWYFDNICVYSESWDDHLSSLRKVFSCLREHNLTVGPAKCFIGYNEIKYLGMKLGNGTISPLHDKIDAINAFDLPTSKKTLRSFIGTVSFYRKFIDKFADLCAPLTDLLKNDSKEPLQWTDIQCANFVELKSKLSSSPILMLPDVSKPFCLRTDASDTGIAGVLFQYHNNIPMPVMYVSRKLIDRERNFSAVEKEALALVWSIDKLKYYLSGVEFIVESDHRPLSYLNKFQNSNPRLMRWVLSLQSYKFRVVYIKGSENIGADMLSRSFSK